MRFIIDFYWAMSLVFHVYHLFFENFTCLTTFADNFIMIC